MRLRHWIYFLNKGFTNILSHRFVHLISIGTISISILFVGAFLLLFLNLNSWVQQWGQALTMSVYLKPGTDSEGKKRIEAVLVDLAGAELRGFITQEMAKKELVEALGDQGGLLDGLGDIELPASFEIVFTDVSSHDIDPHEIKAELEGLDGVDEVQYSEQWIERFEGFFYVLKLVGAIIGILLCVAVLFITTNTIKLTIYSRRDEIEISKIVGATDWFVKMPFLIEGAIQGLVSGLLALAILLLTYSLFSLKSFHLFGIPIIEVVFLSKGHAIGLLGLSLALGLTGSFIAIGRFFKL
jgi:cell division transport system permease protein